MTWHKKPAFVSCQQQRCRPACASTQLCYLLLAKFDSYIISSLYLQFVSVAYPASLNMTGMESWKTDFLTTRPIS